MIGQGGKLMTIERIKRIRIEPIQALVNFKHNYHQKNATRTKNIFLEWVFIANKITCETKNVDTISLFICQQTLKMSKPTITEFFICCSTLQSLRMYSAECSLAPARGILFGNRSQANTF